MFNSDLPWWHLSFDPLAPFVLGLLAYAQHPCWDMDIAQFSVKKVAMGTMAFFVTAKSASGGSEPGLKDFFFLFCLLLRES